MCDDVFAPAKAGEFKPLSLGKLEIWPPVVLAPMAGITNAPFRTLCREFGAGLYVSEMITAGGLVRRDEHTLKLASFSPLENPRSIQLYGIHPQTIGEAVRFIVAELGAGHIDLNFGCPVRKVTRRGGGAAIPLKPRLLRRLIRAAVSNAGEVPVTVKCRIGINDQYITYPATGRIAEEEGCAAISLHARTAAELYSGEAHWEAIARLKQAVTQIPVLGNGDIWQASDAMRMMRETGCDGVVVGRGCLGRPWLFANLAACFNGVAPKRPPLLGETMGIMLRHALLLCDFLGEERAIITFRKHAAWYIKGYPSEAILRKKLVRIGDLEELRSLAEQVPPDEELSRTGLREPRGKQGAPQRVSLPDGYLDNLDDDTPPEAAAEDPLSGG